MWGDSREVWDPRIIRSLVADFSLSFTYFKPWIDQPGAEVEWTTGLWLDTPELWGNRV